MKLDILGGSYQHKYIDFNSQRCINFLPTMTTKNEQNRDKLAYFPTPGLVAHTADLGHEAKDIYVVNDLSTTQRVFAIIDDHLHEIFADGSTTDRGTLTVNINGTLPAYMIEDSENHLTIVSDNRGEIFNLSTNTLAPITDIDFPGADTLEFVDGYFLITPVTEHVGRVRFSELNAPSNWVGDSVYTPTSRSDGVQRIIAWREELYNFGKNTIEVYINDGTTPFQRRRGASQPYGTVAKHAISLAHTGIYFLTGSEKGEPAAYRYESDYTLKPLSPPSINWRLGQVKEELGACTSFIQYSRDGHILWFIHVPALETTLVYDTSTDLWHERQSKAPFNNSDGTPIYGMFRGKKCVSAFGMNLYIDRYSGKILREDYSTFTEDSQHIKREFTSPVMDKEERYISVASLELVHNQGSGPGTIMIEYSKNGGHTFGDVRNIILPASKTYNRRSRLQKLGRGRRWVVRFTCTDAIDLMIMSAIADGNMGGQ